MKNLLANLISYNRKQFDFKLYGLIFLFLLFCFSFNYYYDFEDTVVDGLKGSYWYGPAMFLWMGVPFLGICIVLFITGKNKVWLYSPTFWIKFFIGFSLLAFDRTFNIYPLIQDSFAYIDYRFIGRGLKWSSSLLFTVLPLMIVYMIMENDKPKHYYGLLIKRFDPKPYFILLAIGIVIIGVGSFFSDIQEHYPRYHNSGGEEFADKNNIPNWVSVLIFEMAYGSDFVAVEVFFRGFLIHGFVKILGVYAVLPMVASYAFLHFGKPMTEAISSIFGGYLLGIISYYSKNVWGGVIIHMGIAWAMELFGYLQRII